MFDGTCFFVTYLERERDRGLNKEEFWLGKRKTNLFRKKVRKGSKERDID